MAIAKLIDALEKQYKTILTDEERALLIKSSGRMDEWVVAILQFRENNNKLTEREIYKWFEKSGLFEKTLNQIPASQRIYVLNPFLAPSASFMAVQGYIRNKKLFSPIFAEWFQKSHHIDMYVKNGLTLTREEVQIMQLLAHYIGHVISRDQIAQAIWKEGWITKYSEWLIDTVIYRLRKKLNSSFKIQTVRGRGYVFVHKGKTVKLSTLSHSLVEDVEGTIATDGYIAYMNNPNSHRKILKDLFQALRREKLDQQFHDLFSSKNPLRILIINSYSYDNVDAIALWISKRKNANDCIVFSHTDERALHIHRKRIEELGLESTIKTIFDDIRDTRLRKNSFDLVINDFRLNFNTTHEQNKRTIIGMQKVMKMGTFALISVVVDPRYESSRYGADQEKAPIHLSSPWTFIYSEQLERHCFPVPYYKSLFKNNKLKIVAEFDREEGKAWVKQHLSTAKHEPFYRRFMVKK